MSKQSENRRAAKAFKKGDRVTWGDGKIVCTIVRVLPDGALVREPDGNETKVRFKWSAYRKTYELRSAT